VEQLPKRHRAPVRTPTIATAMVLIAVAAVAGVAAVVLNPVRRSNMPRVRQYNLVPLGGGEVAETTAEGAARSNECRRMGR